MTKNETNLFMVIFTFVILMYLSNFISDQIYPKFLSKIYVWLEMHFLIEIVSPAKIEILITKIESIKN